MSKHTIFHLDFFRCYLLSSSFMCVQVSHICVTHLAHIWHSYLNFQSRLFLIRCDVWTSTRKGISRNWLFKTKKNTTFSLFLTIKRICVSCDAKFVSHFYLYTHKKYAFIKKKRPCPARKLESPGGWYIKRLDLLSSVYTRGHTRDTVNNWPGNLMRAARQVHTAVVSP